MSVTSSAALPLMQADAARCRGRSDNIGALFFLLIGEAVAMSIARNLAQFVTSTNVDDLPPLALERARMVIASTIASAAMGSDIISSRIMRELAQEKGCCAKA